MHRLFNWFLISLALGFTIMAPLFGLFVFIIALMVATAAGIALASVTGIAIVVFSSILILGLFLAGAVAKLGRQVLSVLFIWMVIWGVLVGTMAYILAKPGLDEHERERRLRGEDLAAEANPAARIAPKLNA